MNYGLVMHELLLNIIPEYDAMVNFNKNGPCRKSFHF